MAYTAEQIEERIETLESALGVTLTVQFGDRSTTYKSTDDILAAIEYWKKKLVVLNGGRPKQSVAVGVDGFGCA